jgi:hypothetical protein
MNVRTTKLARMRSVSIHALKLSVEREQTAWLNNIAPLASVLKELKATH